MGLYSVGSTCAGLYSIGLYGVGGTCAISHSFGDTGAGWCSISSTCALSHGFGSKAWVCTQAQHSQTTACVQPGDAHGSSAARKLGEVSHSVGKGPTMEATK